MEDTEAEIDIRHVISSDRPAHPSRFFLAWRSERVRIL